MVQIRQSGIIFKIWLVLRRISLFPYKNKFFANQLNSNRPLNTVFAKLNKFFKIKFDLKNLIQIFVPKRFLLLKSPTKIIILWCPNFSKVNFRRILGSKLIISFGANLRLIFETNLICAFSVAQVWKDLRQTQSQ